MEKMLNITHKFAALGTDFYSLVNPDGLPSPYLIHVNHELKKELGLDDYAYQWWLELASGNKMLPDYQPISTLYAGHQFGVWVPQLGDGRAITIAEHITPNNTNIELQLKGSGKTPYSRGADGRAVLRSSIREYLCSHALVNLNIPTTLALAITGSNLPVYRETPETAAIVLRAAPSFIRFGHFEVFASRNQLPQIKQLADFVINNYYKELLDSPNKYLAWFRKTVEKTAFTIAKWQGVGFCHGVMNSDNMSILGLTIDYGPFGFLDQFNPQHICNHSDHDGRYSYQNQPQIAWWNLERLGVALTSIISEDEMISILKEYPTWFNKFYLAEMGNKLGISNFNMNDLPLLKSLLDILANAKSDWTIFWRKLCTFEFIEQDRSHPIFTLITDSDLFYNWLIEYSARKAKQSLNLNEQQHLMLSTNPKYILRNHLAQDAIVKAQNGDFSEVDRLFSILSQPFAEQSKFDEYANHPPSSAQTLTLSCSS